MADSSPPINGCIGPPHHTPWLLHGNMTQNLVTLSKIVVRHPDAFSRQDKEFLGMLVVNPTPFVVILPHFLCGKQKGERGQIGACTYE